VLSSPSVHLGLAFVLLLLTLAVKAFTVNRLVKRKLRLTLVLAGFAVVLAAAFSADLVPEEFDAVLRSAENLLLAFGVANFLVIVAINPLRADRVPAGFPNIVQDAIIVAACFIVATAIMRETLAMTSAIGAVVVGFALQDTLGNAFAGLALQTEKPFHVGHWVRIGDHEGRVEEMTWRATKIRTKSNTFVIVPNNQVSGEAIVNYSEPVIPTRISVDIGATYLKPPNEVKKALYEAIDNVTGILRNPAPDVLFVDFGESALIFRVRFWIEDYALDEHARDQVRTAIWYAFQRHGIEIPWPMTVEVQRQDLPERPPNLTPQFARALSATAIFAPLTDEERHELASVAGERLFARGELIVRQGAEGRSMFVVCRGAVRVLLEPGGQEVARIEAGGFFGEMSLLTGEPRTATVRAATDCRLMEIDAEGFRRFVLAHPAVVDAVGAIVMERREQLERSRAAGVPDSAAPPESRLGFLIRVRRFLGLAA
jgi:small-conductance mechanosensitive channel/CRP-like cAMP-binding protein